MNNKINYKDNLKYLHRNLLILLISIIVIFILSIHSEKILLNERIENDYERVSEFLENQEIFSKYLNQKRDLYVDLNKVAFYSSGKNVENYTLHKYSSSLSLFGGIIGGGIKRPWGWDTDRLDDRYNYKEIMLTAFLEDFSYWSEKHWVEKTPTNVKGVQLPDSTVRNFYGLERRLFKIIKDSDYILNFFELNLGIKLLFFKDIIQKYNISLEDTLLLKKSSNVDFSYTKNYIYKFLTDSIRTTFFASTLFYDLLDTDVDFQEIHKAYESFCTDFFHKYIKDKYTIFDEEIFNNKLLYTSYINKMKRLQKQYSENLKDISKTQTQIEIPLVKIELSMILFYQLVFWIILILLLITKNALVYHEHIYEELKIISKPGTLHNFETPNILNLILLNRVNKQFLLKLIFFIGYFLTIILLLFGINLNYYDIIYHGYGYLFLLCIIPLIFIFFSLVCFFKKCKINIWELFSKFKYYFKSSVY